MARSLPIFYLVERHYAGQLGNLVIVEARIL
jgi:hypothetical protein